LLLENRDWQSHHRREQCPDIKLEELPKMEAQALVPNCGLIAGWSESVGPAAELTPQQISAALETGMTSDEVEIFEMRIAEYQARSRLSVAD
jgi:hypothetical protein